MLGVGIPAFRISGGLLLFWIAFEMVFERRNERKQHTADVAITEDHIRNVAAFPLAIPLMAGPGAITAIILLAGRANGQLTYLSALIALIALGVTSCFVVFMAADRVSRWLGVTGNIVLSRLLGVILAGPRGAVHHQRRGSARPPEPFDAQRKVSSSLVIRARRGAIDEIRPYS